VDVREYIASGILESVVIGSATEQEVREVRCLAKIYPEIAQEFDTITASYENIALSEALAPPADFKARVMAAIRNEKQEMPATAESEAPIIQMQPAERRSNPWQWMAAASIVMLIGIGVLWYGSTRMNKQLSGEIAGLRKENKKSENVLMAMQLEQERSQAIQKVLTDESMQNVTMQGLPKDPQAKVKVMWSDDSEKAIMQAVNITPPPTDMQYQLWAIADGKPVSLGVFDYDEVMGMTEPFEVYGNNITAFAITLEKRGGSPAPTMENMVVMGAVNS
jgi:hypothetical protein